ncbi:hypothetical protein PIIN_08892 [Serendipita indica DSM 11827]|uniref:Uncharacterized protein n=1 Tax=Serendipita indica (strain DSM 11827) TaxID=1109443 RepID=G4TUC9_SERID|nr:hypothetical protein PIIN_08892 [Serendipita indica DSM 11827]
MTVSESLPTSHGFRQQSAPPDSAWAGLGLSGSTDPINTATAEIMSTDVDPLFLQPPNAIEKPQTPLPPPLPNIRVPVVFWSQLPNAMDRPFTWSFNGMRTHQGIVVIPSSSIQFCNLLKSPFSENQQVIAYFNYKTNTWHGQEVEEPIITEEGRPVLLCNYRIISQMSVDWDVVKDLTEYEHPSFQRHMARGPTDDVADMGVDPNLLAKSVNKRFDHRSARKVLSPVKESRAQLVVRGAAGGDKRRRHQQSQPYLQSAPSLTSLAPPFLPASRSASPAKGEDRWWANIEAKTMLHKVAKFERDVNTDNGANAEGSAVLVQFQNMFDNPNISKSSMGRVRRAVRKLSFEELEEFIYLRPTEPFKTLHRLTSKRDLEDNGGVNWDKILEIIAAESVTAAWFDSIQGL